MNRDAHTRKAIDLMPKDKRSQQILHERAIALAQQSTTQQDEQNLVHYVRFRLGENEYYGMPYPSIIEVIDNAVPTHLPCTIDCIAGVINRRGNLLTLIDLKKFFHSTSSISINHANIIIIHSDGMSVGILADYIVGSAAYNEEKLNVITPYEGVIDPQYMIGLHEGITAILNIDTILLDLKKQLQQNVSKENSL